MHVLNNWVQHFSTSLLASPSQLMSGKTSGIQDSLPLAVCLIWHQEMFEPNLSAVHPSAIRFSFHGTSWLFSCCYNSYMIGFLDPLRLLSSANLISRARFLSSQHQKRVRTLNTWPKGIYGDVIGDQPVKLRHLNNGYRYALPWPPRSSIL